MYLYQSTVKDVQGDRSYVFLIFVLTYPAALQCWMLTAEIRMLSLTTVSLVGLAFSQPNRNPGAYSGLCHTTLTSGCVGLYFTG